MKRVKFQQITDGSWVLRFFNVTDICSNTHRFVKPISKNLKSENRAAFLNGHVFSRALFHFFFFLTHFLNLYRISQTWVWLAATCPEHWRAQHTARRFRNRKLRAPFHRRLVFLRAAPTPPRPVRDAWVRTVLQANCHEKEMTETMTDAEMMTATNVESLEKREKRPAKDKKNNKPRTAR